MTNWGRFVLFTLAAVAVAGVSVYSLACKRDGPLDQPVGIWSIDHVKFQPGSHPMPPKTWTIELQKDGKFVQKQAFPPSRFRVEGGVWKVNEGRIELAYKWYSERADGSGAQPIGFEKKEQLIPDGKFLTLQWFDKYYFARAKKP